MGKGIDENELAEALDSAWRDIYASLPQPLKAGEKTLAMMQDELLEMGIRINGKTLRAQMDEKVKSGELIFVGRRIGKSGKPADAWAVNQFSRQR